MSFTLESRLFIVVWRAQLEERQLFDSHYLRTKLTSFYFQFYFVCFVMIYFQQYLLYETWSILVFCGSLWIPQIVHSYRQRSRKGPSAYLATSLFTMQTFMPLYLKAPCGNFLDQEPSVLALLLLISFMALQLIVMKL